MPLSGIERGIGGVVSSLPFGRAVAAGALDKNLAVRMIARLKQLHRLVEEGVQWHGARIDGLIGSGEFGGDIGREQFKHLDRHVAELMTQSLQPAVEEGLGRAISRKVRARHESEFGAGPPAPRRPAAA